MSEQEVTKLSINVNNICIVETYKKRRYEVCDFVSYNGLGTIITNIISALPKGKKLIVECIEKNDDEKIISFSTIE